MRPRILANPIMGHTFFLVMLLFCLTASSTAGAKPTGLAITADRLEMDDKNQIAIFTGHVIAEDSRMRLAADKMTVYYDKKSKNSSNKGGVREVKAEGQVILQQEKNKGIADAVHYQLEKQTLELIGNNQDATIQRENDLLTGRRILVTLDNEQRISKVVVQGSENHRVSARITPSGLMERVETPLRVNNSPSPPPIPLPPDSGEQKQKEVGEQKQKEVGETQPPKIEHPEPVMAAPDAKVLAPTGSQAKVTTDLQGETTEPEKNSIETPRQTNWILPAPQPRRRSHAPTLPKQ